MNIFETHCTFVNGRNKQMYIITQTYRISGNIFQSALVVYAKYYKHWTMFDETTAIPKFGAFFLETLLSIQSGGIWRPTIPHTR